MAEARSQLQLSASAGEQQVTEIKLPPSAGSILRKPKYSSTSEGKGSDIDTKTGSNALGGLIGGYSSSEDENEGGAAAVSKKYDAQHSFDCQKYVKKAKFSDDAQVRAITDRSIDSDQINVDVSTAEPIDAKKVMGTKTAQPQEPTKESSKENISDEVWDEFNALLEDDPDEVDVGGDNDTAREEVNTKTTSASEQVVSISQTTTAPSDATKPKKKKKKQSFDKSYDNEAVTNVEQASYEARLARLVLLKSKLQTAKHGNVEFDETKLASVDFYDPGLAFQQDDDSVTEEDDNKAVEGTSSITGTSMSNAPHMSLSGILRKRRKEARQMSGYDEDVKGSKQDVDADLVDGGWF